MGLVFALVFVACSLLRWLYVANRLGATSAVRADILILITQAICAGMVDKAVSDTHGVGIVLAIVALLESIVLRRRIQQREQNRGV